MTDQLGQAFNFPAKVWLSSDPGKNLIVTLMKGEEINIRCKNIAIQKVFEKPFLSLILK